MKKTAELMTKAIEAFQSGNVPKAERAYRDVLKIDGQHYDALRQLGILYLQSGHPDQAVPVLDRALRLNQSDAETWMNMGYACRLVGQFGDALTHYQRALKIAPRDARIYNNIGDLFCMQRKGGMAIPYLIQALQLKPDYAEAHFNLANVFHEQGRVKESVAFYDQALREKPGFIDAMINRGIALSNLGNFQLAHDAFQEVLSLQPDHYKALNNLGYAMRYLGDPEGSLALFDKALVIHPNYQEAYINRGTSLRDLGRLDEALQSFKRANVINPDNPSTLISLGTMEQDFGNLEKSLGYYQKALTLQPSSPDAKWNMALALLGLGRMKDGWTLYEGGFGVRTLRGVPLYTTNRWDGSPLSGKRLLIWREQGLGDSLQFVRYAQMAKKAGAYVIVHVDTALEKLFQATPFIDEIVTEVIPPEKFDFQASMMSLPHLFGTTIETVPANVPYLFANETKRAFWRDALKSYKGAKIGIVWAGRSRKEQANAFMIDKRRSLTLDRFAPLFDVDGASFFSLQIGPSAEEIQTLGYQDKVVDLTANINDFADTAAFVAELDLVISVDTSVVHMTGGLDKPVWVLSRFDACWRWLQNKPQNPWYPSARVFGQKVRGEWDEVILRVREELPAFCQSIR